MSSTLPQDPIEHPRGRSLPAQGTAGGSGLPTTMLRVLVVVALLAVVLGRAMAQALPGSRSGLGRLLDVNNWTAAFFTQLLAVLLVVTAGRLTVMMSLDRRVNYGYRLLVTPAASVVVCLIAFACLDVLIGPYTPELSLLLGVAAALVAVGAAIMCAEPARVRAGAIIIGLAAASSLAQVTARLLAMQASDAALPRQYLVSRWVASAGALLDAASLVITVLWIIRRDRLSRLSWLGTGGFALVVSFLAARGGTPRANFAEVLVSRLLAQLHREPSAVFPRFVLDAQETFALVIAAWLLRRPREAPLALRACLSLVLLSRGSPDIPLCAGLLVTGAMGLVALAAATRSAEQLELTHAATGEQASPESPIE